MIIVNVTITIDAQTIIIMAENCREWETAYCVREISSLLRAVYWVRSDTGRRLAGITDQVIIDQLSTGVENYWITNIAIKK